MGEHQASYTTPVYPAIGIVTNSPAPCPICGGAMVADLVLDGLHICTACGWRRGPATTQAAAAIGLKPCPYCGGPGTVAPADLTAATWVVVCHACDIEGPWTEDKQQAIELWNTRAAAACSSDDIRALFDEVLADLQSTWLASSDGFTSDRELIQDDIDDYRRRFEELLRKAD